ncbi:MAG: penicillin-binding protein 2 [Actinomycetota bacterium]|nr:penicillin-binding protein 2 [Actinomycetota bacterium]
MNAQIVRLYVFVLVLFAGLIYFTSRWAVLEADELKANRGNNRPLIEEQQIKRGTITSSDGVLIAESLPEGGGPQRVYVRRYPEGALFGNPVGYSFVEVERSGVELAENELLTGEKNEFASLIDELLNETQVGNDVTLTLDAAAQRVATGALQTAVANSGAKGGSVVAIEPDTGAVKVMASVPGFDPNAVKSPSTFSELSEQGTSSGLFFGATQATYPPGSTMKVVTAAAALDSGEFDPTTTLSGASPQTVSGAPLSNSGNQSFGTIDMTTALTNSVNTYWAQVGERLGTGTYMDYMERFGFNSDPQLNYPDEQMAPSGVYESGSLLGRSDLIDVGRVAIGQERLLATPLQMTQVASAVANGGELMKPTLLQGATDPDGREVEELDPDVQSDVMSAETAAQVTEMMTQVASIGTAASLSTSLGELAGKTGTAELNIEQRLNQPWFIGFAPAGDPQIAIAATLEPCTGCFGADDAGPVATQVMDALAGG